MDGFIEKLFKDPRFYDKELYYGILFVLGQNYFFSVEDKGLTVRELANISNRSKQSIRQALKDLYDMGVLKTKGKRPVIYLIDERYIEE